MLTLHVEVLAKSLGLLVRGIVVRTPAGRRIPRGRIPAMSPGVRAALGLVALVQAIALAQSAAEIDPGWLGLWRLNLERSIYRPGPPPYRRATYRIERRANGIHVVYDMVRPRGGVTHLEWTGQFDGRDYPVQGVEEFVTYAYRRIDERTYDVVTKVDGRPAAISRAVLSADGRTITTTTAGRDSRGVDVTTITVYEKHGT
jgi:hypothetical protein